MLEFNSFWLVIIVHFFLSSIMFDNVRLVLTLIDHVWQVFTIFYYGYVWMIVTDIWLTFLNHGLLRFSIAKKVRLWLDMADMFDIGQLWITMVLEQFTNVDYP